jgi:hemerythrin-like domain-containing protein
MIKTAPIKRSKELVSLSREHHDGLLLCWKINSGLKKDIQPVRISSYIVHFFDNDLDKHFTEEELYLFPVLDNTSPFRIEAETQHKKLREMVRNSRSNTQISADSLKAFAELLNEHIRFEERTLFNLIEKEAGQELLKSIEEKLNPHNKCNTDWHDQFWLN